MRAGRFASASAILGGLFAAGAVCLISGHALAQAYPEKPVRVVVPFDPGGGADIAARQITTKLPAEMKQSFIVDNRGGAGGLIGIENVAKSPPDGYSLLASSASFSATLATHRTGAETINSLIAVSQTGFSPFVLLVPVSSPVKTVAELIALAREKNGELTYASAGVGSNTHLGLALLASMANIKMLHVPYKGAAPSLIDLMNGRVDVTLAAYSSSEGNIKAGKLRALGVTNSRRVPTLPSLPAVGETVPGYQVELWFGILAPKGTPAGIVSQLNAAINRIVKNPENRKGMEAIGILPEAGTPQQFDDLIRGEYARWRRVIKESNIRTD